MGQRSRGIVDGTGRRAATSPWRRRSRTPRTIMVVVLSMLVTAAVLPASATAAGDGGQVDATQSPSIAALGALLSDSRPSRDVLLAALEEPAPSSGMVAASSEAASVAGVVRDSDDNGLEGMCAAVFNAPYGEEGLVAATLTDASGRYVLADLPPDSYRLLFLDCNEPAVYAHEWFVDAASYATALPLELEAGMQVVDADVHLMLGANVSGRVRDAATGAPVGGICAAALDEGFTLVDAVLTDGVGEYALVGLRPGDHYMVFVDCRESPTYALGWWGGASSLASATTLRLSPGGTRSGVDGSLVPGGRVTGQVADGDGSPVADMCAAVFEAGGGLLLAAQSVQDGSYAVEGVVPGSHRVLFTDCAQTPRYEDSWFDGEASAEDADPVVVDAGHTTSGIDAVVSPLPDGVADPLPDPGTPGPPRELDEPEDPPAAEACPAGEVPRSGFEDIVGSVHEAAIDCVAWWEIARGVSEERYAPGRTVRRDQMASFLARLMEALGYDLPAPSDQGFTDVAGNVHADRINQLAAVGVTMGATTTTYAPSAGVRRDQMATFLVRALETVTGQELASGGSSFTDVAGNVHEANIDKVAAAEITLGAGDGTVYEPRREVRRDQMASFLARTLDQALGMGVSASGGGDTSQATAASWRVGTMPDARVGCFRGPTSQMRLAFQPGLVTPAPRFSSQEFWFRMGVYSLGADGRWHQFEEGPWWGPFTVQPFDIGAMNFGFYLGKWLRIDVPQTRHVVVAQGAWRDSDGWWFDHRWTTFYSQYDWNGHNYGFGPYRSQTCWTWNTR
jgi:hypothetical protein